LEVLTVGVGEGDLVEVGRVVVANEDRADVRVEELVTWLDEATVDRMVEDTGVELGVEARLLLELSEDEDVSLYVEEETLDEAAVEELRKDETDVEDPLTEILDEELEEIADDKLTLVYMDDEDVAGEEEAGVEIALELVLELTESHLPKRGLQPVPQWPVVCPHHPYCEQHSPSAKPVQV
jgi:hypothetical protein